MLDVAKGNFVVVGLNLPTRKCYWNGVELTEVLSSVSHVDEDTNHIKLTVQNTTNFDAVYAQMTAAGIKIKKGN